MNSLARAKELIESLPKDARVIELAGPTPSGNRFLKENKLYLLPKPLITNSENPVLFRGLPPYPKKILVDEIANVHHLAYHDVDMFLCSYLPWYNDYRYTRKELPKRLLARLHYKLKYLSSHANPRISLFRETAKALKSGGLLLVEGIFDEDFPIAKKAGFELVYTDSSDAALFKLS